MNWYCASWWLARVSPDHSAEVNWDKTCDNGGVIGRHVRSLAGSARNYDGVGDELQMAADGCRWLTNDLGWRWKDDVGVANKGFMRIVLEALSKPCERNPQRNNCKILNAVDDHAKQTVAPALNTFVGKMARFSSSLTVATFSKVNHPFQPFQDCALVIRR